MSRVWLLSNKTPSRLLKTGLSASTVITLRLVQRWNAAFPMLVTLLPIVTLVRLAQDSNAHSPMLVTLLGIVTLVRLGLLKNARNPMLVTDRPLIVSGMATAPPGPVYPVMMIVPLLVT